MRSVIVLVIIFGVLAGGCIGDTSVTETGTESISIPVTDMQQINESLEEGPVLLKIGAEWCPPCQEQDPIIDALAKEYEGRAAVMHIDTDASSELAMIFNVYSIPDSCVIVDREEGQYVYMGLDGITDNTRERVRFLGLTNKQILATTLDHAIELRANQLKVD
ncbi:MAG: thioredoxin family protein [Euryarchaeota archaeon]|nr:thioredoxin family protein [Euryarchaeota archaeon]